MLGRRDTLPQFERSGDEVQGFVGRSDPADENGPVTEQPAEDRLGDIDSLHLIHIDLDGLPGDEPVFDDGAPVGDDDLGRRAFNESGEERYAANDEK